MADRPKERKMKHVDYMAMSHHALALRCAAAESDHAAVAAAAEAATVAAFLALADAWGGLVAGCNVGRVYVASDRIDILDPSPAVAAWACPHFPGFSWAPLKRHTPHRSTSPLGRISQVFPGPH